MKTFKDIKFEDHSLLDGSYQGKLELGGGNTISVVYGGILSPDENAPYEITVLKNGRMIEFPQWGDIVISGLTEEDVNKIMIEYQIKDYDDRPF